MAEPVQSPPTKVRHTYFPAFDIFRGIGILFVILGHTPTANATIAALRPIGALGVHMFFALSGFLITYRLIEEEQQTGRISLTQFYRRRVRRILPPALIYLATLGILGPLLRILPTSPSEITASTFVYRNLYQPPMPDAWYTAHFWTLSLEEQFYLIWPLLLVLLGARRSRTLWTALAIIAATIAWRIWALSVDPIANIYRTDLLADHLLWGCVLGMIWPQVRAKIARTKLLWIGIAGVFAAAALLYQQPRNWQPQFAFLVAVGFVSSADGIETWRAPWTWFRTLGEASYDCYIWQSLFLPLAWVGLPITPQTNALGWMQQAPWNYLLITALTTCSFQLTFPRRRKRGK
ncbi:MAG: acyltransferase [Acidobacteriota bacterium]